MNHASIWENHSLKKRIAYLINYSSVFNDVIHLAELKNIIDPVHDSVQGFETALKELRDEGAIIIRGGFAGIPILEDKMAGKSYDHFIADSAMIRLKKTLLLIGKLPIIKFIGISGSIAASNPVENSKSKLDMDIFIITRRQCMWFVCFLEALYRNLGIRSMMKIPFCFNYIMDESDLKVHNRNFYTATEIKNIKPVSGLPSFALFLSQNKWVHNYYPHLKLAYSNIPVATPSPYYLPVNEVLYIIYNIFRCFKKLSFRPLRELSFEFQPGNVLNISRKIQPYGGYQYFISQKFEKNLRKYFPQFYDPELLNLLFKDNSETQSCGIIKEQPASSSTVKEKNQNIDSLISKYE